MALPTIHGHNLCGRAADEITPLLIFMDQIAGHPLSTWGFSAIDVLQRDIFLQSLARFLLDLWSTEVPEADMAGLGVVPRTYAEWLVSELDRAISIRLDNDNVWGNIIDFLVMRAWVHLYIKDVNTKFGKRMAVGHGNLDENSIMIGEDHSVEA